MIGSLLKWQKAQALKINRSGKFGAGGLSENDHLPRFSLSRPFT
jgi:hypothetical protein